MSEEENIVSAEPYKLLVEDKETTLLEGDNVPNVLRFSILLCICFLTFGSYWVFDTPGAIQKQLEEWFGPSYDDSKNALLYSIYSWPNMFLALFGGFIVDRITGVRLGAIIFCSLIWIGQFVFSIGIQSKIYPLCVFGRFIFGLGGESLTVVQNTFVIRWFSKTPYIALVFGLVLAFARVGSSVNFAVTPTLTEYGVPFSVWFGVGMCSLSLVMCLILVFLDYKGSAYVEKPVAQADVQEESVEEAPKFSDILSFPKAAWILFLICCFFYQGVLTFYQVASKIMQETGRRYPSKTATLFLSIPNFMSIVASPTFGRVVDTYGNAVSFLILASWGLISCHILFLLNAYDVIFIHPSFIMVVLGLCYALGAASMWPLLAHIIPSNMVSTGYGVMTSIQNVGLSVFPILIATIQSQPSIAESSHKYGVPIIIFISCVFFASLCAVALYTIDKNELGGRLNASSTQRKAMIEAEKATLIEPTFDEKFVNDEQ